MRRGGLLLPVTGGPDGRFLLGSRFDLALLYDLPVTLPIEPCIRPTCKGALLAALLPEGRGDTRAV